MRRSPSRTVTNHRAHPTRSASGGCRRAVRCTRSAFSEEFGDALVADTDDVCVGVQGQAGPRQMQGASPDGRDPALLQVLSGIVVIRCSCARPDSRRPRHGRVAEYRRTPGPDERSDLQWLVVAHRHRDRDEVGQEGTVRPASLHWRAEQLRESRAHRAHPYSHRQVEPGAHDQHRTTGLDPRLRAGSIATNHARVRNAQARGQ